MLAETLAVTSDGSYGPAVVAAVALVVGGVLTQVFNYLSGEEHAVNSELRTRFVLERTDIILEWGRELETSILETEKEGSLPHLKAARGMYGVAARAALRQDMVLGTTWEKRIGEVQAVVKSALEVSDTDYEESTDILASCQTDVANLLNEVEWWRIFLLRNPMPSRMSVLLRNSVSWGYLGPRKQRVSDS